MRKQLQLCTVGRHNAGTHPRVKVQSAGWVNIESAPTLVNRQFLADAPNRLSVADMTCIPT